MTESAADDNSFALTVLEAAFDYASIGLEVFPVNRNKKPMTANGFHDASAEKGLVANMFLFNPSANIAAAVPNGHVVLDIDPRNGGDNTLSSLQHSLGELPDTLTAHTGGGGLHLWFTLPEGYRPAASGLGPGVDVKKAGAGYVILPPSVHSSGTAYSWVDDSAETAPLPATWRDEMRQSTSQRRNAISTTAAEAIEWLQLCSEPHTPRGRMRRISRLGPLLEKMATASSAHNLMTRRVYEAVALAAEGDDGVLEALRCIRRSFRETQQLRRRGQQSGSARSDTEAIAEYDAAVRSAVAKFRRQTAQVTL